MDIKKLNDNEKIDLVIFGKERSIKVVSLGDNQFENGEYKEKGFALTKEEISLLNWLLENVNLDDYKDKIICYINEMYSTWSDNEITIDDLENEVKINKIVISIVSRDVKYFPDISFVGKVNCDENGICIGFKNKEFLGIESEDWVY